MIQLFPSQLFSSAALSDYKEIKVSKQNIDNKNIHQNLWIKWTSNSFFI